MKTIAIILLFSSSLIAQSNSDWQILFNEKDLDGWDIKIANRPVNENYKNTFKVEDKMIRIVYDEYESFNEDYGHLYYHQPFSHYILDYNYRFTGTQTQGGAIWNDRNSGIMFHSQSAQSLSFKQGFPVSLEMQLLGGLNKGQRTTGNLCTPGTQVFMNDSLKMEHCINSTSKTYNGDQWVKARLVVLGDSIIHQIIEADTVLTYHKPQISEDFVNSNLTWQKGGFTETDAQYWHTLKNTPLKSGYIALQAESHPIDFKDIKLLNLKGCMNPEAKNFKSYYIENDEELCRF